MIVIVDGDHLVARCYYATKDSSETNGGARAFMASLHRLIRDFIPQYIVVCWGDRRENLWRRKKDPAYKAHRESAPDDLVFQVKAIKALLGYMGIPQTLCEGFEADDVIASIALETTKFHVPVAIVSGDHDLFQLIADQPSPIFCLIPSKGGYQKIKEVDVIEKYGIEPCQLPRLMAIVGEKGDGVKGIVGIGKKRAVDYIKGIATDIVKEKIESNQEITDHNFPLVNLLSIQVEDFPGSTLEVEHQNFNQKGVMKTLLSLGLFGKQSVLYQDIMSMIQLYRSIREKKAVTLDELLEEL